MLKVPTSATWEEKKMLIQTALVKGFLSEAAEFPIASLTGDEEVPNDEKVLFAQFSEYSQVLPDDYQAASEFAQPIPDFDWRSEKGLETIFQTGKYLKDENLDQLPDKLDFKLILPTNTTPSILIAACNFAFRFGMETTQINDWLLDKEYISGNALIIRESTDCRLTEEPGKDGQLLVLQGSGEDLEQFSALVCESFPELSSFETWTSYLQQVTDSFLLKNLDGQLSYLQSLDGQKAIAYVSPEIDSCLASVQEKFPETTFKNYKAMQQVYEKSYDLSWEVDDFRKELSEKVFSVLKPGDKVEIVGVLSEDKKVRESLKKKIEAEIIQMEALLTGIQLVCAHKQGYSWMDEYVIPALKDRSIEKLTIAFKPFMPEGFTEWTTESGAVPSYNNLDSQDPEKWNDLPIRYLQELYPIQDTLIRKLGISKDQIVFTTYAGDEAITYKVSAEDKRGAVVFTDNYSASYSERPYLDAYPGLGKVHPPTGKLQVKINGKCVVEKRLATDVEKIWECYQKDVLPDCRAFVLESVGGNLDKGSQPFFARLKIEVTASEPNHLLSSRNDMISSLNALHEDLYFAGSDYFKNFGYEVCGELFEEPGLILPVIKQGSGKPVLKVTLFDQLTTEPMIISQGSVVSHPKNREEIIVFLQEIGYKNQQLTAKISVEGVDNKVLQAYLKLLEQRLVAQTVDFSKFKEITFVSNQNIFKAEVPCKKKIEEKRKIETIDFYEDQVIGYDQYLAIIQQLREVPEVTVYPIATSYLGREIYAIELAQKTKGYYSRTKRLTNYPSVIINARHHANEVSGTNGAFLLIKELLTNESYRDVAEQLNLVVVPMENVDGSAIHYELQQDNPHWKLHVARFNAVGKEFYYDYFDSNTKHPEALGMTRLYERFLPDVMIDNHGVPTHEWEQPFSGYTSPSYKGFWLPRSLLYGYFWVVTNDEYRWNLPVNKKLEEVIANAIAQQSEMRDWNLEWAQQFETYAHRWLPKLFPAEYYKEMINYWIEFAADATHRYSSIRFPWITSVAYTSEVADETAQGEYLRLCAKTHLVHDLATIDMLLAAKKVYQHQTEVTPNSFKLYHTRLRPIIV
ncbi:M14 family metallopeptidase [Enterococcus sp. AZ109]|uniref:M14 family metallopeptidase n=1 Tax=Enterococcus sp. AZ109 TaxID=2774634 RepID=UPI003F25A329